MRQFKPHLQAARRQEDQATLLLFFLITLLSFYLFRLICTCVIQQCQSWHWYITIQAGHWVLMTWGHTFWWQLWGGPRWSPLAQTARAPEKQRQWAAHPTRGRYINRAPGAWEQPTRDHRFLSLISAVDSYSWTSLTSLLCVISSFRRENYLCSSSPVSYHISLKQTVRNLLSIFFWIHRFEKDPTYCTRMEKNSDKNSCFREFPSHKLFPIKIRLWLELKFNFKETDLLSLH